VASERAAAMVAPVEQARSPTEMVETEETEESADQAAGPPGVEVTVRLVPAELLVREPVPLGPLARTARDVRCSISSIQFREKRRFSRRVPSMMPG
jgi:hypothetical protein